MPHSRLRNLHHIDITLREHTTRQRLRPCPRASGQYNEFDDLQDVEAMQEAVEIYKTAKEISSLQTRAELEREFYADVAASTSAEAPASASAAISFWVEQGLSQSEASRYDAGKVKVE